MAYRNPLTTVVYERDFFQGVILTQVDVVNTPIKYLFIIVFTFYP